MRTARDIDLERFWRDRVAKVYYGTGRRKTAVARVYLEEGKSGIRVNGRDFENYFPRDASRLIVEQPLKVTGTLGDLGVKVNLSGGGLSSQAGALRHGIARALLLYNPELRGTLKKEGFLRRDPREVERKKYGHHKARKKPQYSKR
jgi:small subunit ribosomal protein S9